MSKDAKILIVEDEPHINRLIEIVLISDGYYKIKKALHIILIVTPLMLSLEFLRSVMLFGLAEREGFEPPVPLSTTVFKTVVIDHSTISHRPLYHLSFCREDKLCVQKRVQR